MKARERDGERSPQAVSVSLQFNGHVVYVTGYWVKVLECNCLRKSGALKN